jgi:hypothetical protein
MNIPTTQWVPLVPSDTIDPDIYVQKKLLTWEIYVGSSGDVAAVDQSGTATIFPGVPAGTVLKVAARRVNASGTTASGLVACYLI